MWSRRLFDNKSKITGPAQIAGPKRRHSTTQLPRGSSQHFMWVHVTTPTKSGGGCGRQMDPADHLAH